LWMVILPGGESASNVVPGRRINACANCCSSVRFSRPSLWSRTSPRPMKRRRVSRGNRQPPPARRAGPRAKD
jgi:hypothetical protein